MKSSFSLAAALLAVTPTFASPITSAITIDSVIEGPPSSVSARAAMLEDRTVCNADNVLRALGNPTASAGASVFCSAYLQPTTTVTTTSIVAQTSTATTFTTDVVSSSTTATQTVPTTTVLCAASPTYTLTTCNYPAYGFSYYLISQHTNIDPVTCHQLCLSDANCKSFQVQSGGQQYCNLYNQATYGFTQYAPGDVYTFFDRDCSQYLAAQRQ